MLFKKAKQIFNVNRCDSDRYIFAGMDHFSMMSDQIMSKLRPNVIRSCNSTTWYMHSVRRERAVSAKVLLDMWFDALFDDLKTILVIIEKNSIHGNNMSTNICLLLFLHLPNRYQFDHFICQCKKVEGRNRFLKSKFQLIMDIPCR